MVMGGGVLINISVISVPNAIHVLCKYVYLIDELMTFDFTSINSISPYRVSSRLGFAMRRLEDSLSLFVNPAVNGYLFRIREG